MKQVVFIGQAPARPNTRHEIAGTYLQPWLSQLGLAEETITEYFHFYALTDSFPGTNMHGHLRPTSEQILKHRPVLIKLIKGLEPDIIVPVGTMAIKEVIPTIGGTLSDIIGSVYKLDPFESIGREIIVIPWPHPSGRSIWLNANPDKVVQALQVLKKHLA
jgi:uracil-DNA glycosylase